MKMMFTFLLILGQLSQALACNIPEQELMVRIGIMKATQRAQMNLHDTSRILTDVTGNISKKEYNQLIDSVKKVYVPIFRKKGQNFRIEEAWDDNQVNAFAGVRGSDRYILLYGGYARHPLMTKDAYLSVICHEIGHHLGGFPLKATSNWSSSEGQADYFSTLKCMKEVLRTFDDNVAVALKIDLPKEIQTLCSMQYPADNEYFICLRSAKAAEDHGQVLNELIHKGIGEPVSLMTPSLERVLLTNLQHPSPQCRLDTKFQGALCNMPTRIPLDLRDETKGACHFAGLMNLGSRPSCWFVPTK